jgi:hypothetical protein
MALLEKLKRLGERERGSPRKILGSLFTLAHCSLKDGLTARCFHETSLHTSPYTKWVSPKLHPIQHIVHYISPQPYGP